MNPLENYPHVLRRIDLLWRTPQLVPYIESLLLMEPGKNREGFSHEAFDKLLDLVKTHQKLCPL